MAESLNPEYYMWQQLTERQCKAFYDNNLMKGFTSDQIVRIQLIQQKTLFEKPTIKKAYADVFGRHLSNDEIAFKNAALLKEYIAKGNTAPTFEEFVDLIPEHRRYLIGIKTIIVKSPNPNQNEKK